MKNRLVNNFRDVMTRLTSLTGQLRNRVVRLVTPLIG
jgi:hypothetical protein